MKRREGDKGGSPRIFEMAGLPNTYRLYDLRHTFGTHAVTATDPKTVAELMGHTKVQTTLDLYTHPDATRKREAVEKLSDVYGARPRV